MTLKPMNVGEILDNSLTMFREQYKSYLAVAGIGAAVSVVFSLIILIATFFIGKIVGGIVIIVGVILSVLVYLAIGGALIKMASEQLNDRKISVMAAVGFGFGKSGRLLLASILDGLILIIGCILLIIPGIYLGISFVLYLQAIVIEDKGVIASLKRSKSMTKGSWWRTFGIVVLVSALVAIFSYVIKIPISILILWLLKLSFTGQIINIILSALVNLALAPFSMIAFTLLYYDLRVRKENLDLKLMVDNLAEAGVQQPGE